MTLNEWEQSNIEVLTSREMGEWLCRRENRLLEQIRAEIEECKQYRGMTGNPIIDKHNVGLDKYYDLGLEKAIKIIDKYKGDKE